MSATRTRERGGASLQTNHYGTRGTKTLSSPRGAWFYIYIAETLYILDKNLIRSSATATRRNGTLEAGPSSDAVEQRANNEANRRARLFGGLFGIRV